MLASLDQVRRLLPRRAARRRDHVRDQPAARRRRSRRASSTAPSPTVTVLGDGAEIPAGRRRGHGAARLRARKPRSARRRREPTLPDHRRDRPRLHRVDERHHRRAEGRGLRPRAHGGDLAQHGPAHRARRPPARRAAVRARRLHDPDVGRARERHDDRASRASRGRRPRRCASSATRTSRWAPASRRSGSSCSRTPTSPRTDFSQRAGVRHRRRRGLARSRAPDARDPRLPGAHPLHEHRGRRHHEHARSATPTRSSRPPSAAPAPEVELRIVSPADERRRRPTGEVGEIVCRSPAMMRGYWRDPETHRRPSIDADGWLHTGDLGTRRRRRQRAHRRPAQGDVHPRRLQRVPGRGRGGARRPSGRRAGRGRRAARSGARRDRRRVRRRRRPGARRPSSTTLRDWCRARIADYKAPDRLVVVDAFPVTAMHKVDKAALRAAYATTEET